MQYAYEDLEYNMYMKPTCTAFIKATLDYNNTRGLRINFHSLTDSPQQLPDLQTPFVVRALYRCTIFKHLYHIFTIPSYVLIYKKLHYVIIA